MDSTPSTSDPMLTKTTITILRARNTQLMHENGVLRRRVARLSQLIDLAGVELDPKHTQLDELTPDYGPGGQEWIDPASGADTWHS